MKTLTPNTKLEYLAKRYVWWESPKWSYQHPEVFLANVMNMGTWEDTQTLRKEISEEQLRQVLREASPGYFSYRSWDYWHLRLGFKTIPPLPKRKFL
jgi:hypothetical protein